MEEIPGEWAAQEIRRKLSADGSREVAEFTNNYFGMRLFRCKTCGLVQFYDWVIA
jgi:hypothetical protein